MTIYAGDNVIKVNYGQWWFLRSSGLRHKGADISTKGDPTIHSTVSGRVKWARVVAKGAAGWGDTWQWGYFVWIVADDGTSHIFAHCKANSLLVKEGQRVTAGQAIATMGNTGNASGDAQGPHCHYEVRNSANTAIDPTPWCGGNNTAGVVWYGKNKQEDEVMPMSTSPVKMWFGPMSGGDAAQFDKMLKEKAIPYVNESGLLSTTVAVSKGDQTGLMQLAVDLAVGYGPVTGGDCSTVETELTTTKAKLVATERALSAEKEARATAEANYRNAADRADKAQAVLDSAKTIRVLEV